MWGLIETDSPVPPTADGGALVGTDGSFGLSLHLSADAAMGYAVPIDAAWTVGMDLLEHGRARAARLGVDSEDVDEARASELGIAGGARLVDGGSRRVRAAQPGCARATSCSASAPTRSAPCATSPAACTPTGRARRSQIVVWRDDEQLTLPVTLGEKPQK